MSYLTIILLLFISWLVAGFIGVMLGIAAYEENHDNSFWKIIFNDTKQRTRIDAEVFRTSVYCGYATFILIILIILNDVCQKRKIKWSWPVNLPKSKKQKCLEKFME